MNSMLQVFIFAFILLHGFDLCVSGPLKVGFYSKTCPNAESIVNFVVKKATEADNTIPPALLRLQFHDCLVQGCDGSVLVAGGEQLASEHSGLRGFDQINRAKELIEAQCPGVVSCADIVAIAARDAVILAGGPAYEVETGRPDGRISRASLAAVIPDVKDSIATLISKFRDNGLSNKDLVVLSGGGHTIGTTACFFMTDRLYHFNGNGFDPAIDPKFLQFLKNKCPNNGHSSDIRTSLDPITSDTFDDQVFRNIKNGLAVLASDARLYDDGSTKKLVDSYLGKFNENFATDFADAMVRMGRIGVKNSSHGEIRRVCSAMNN